MYTAFEIIKKYLRYRATASNGRGHGVHSPFVFDFIETILRDKTTYSCYPSIESIRSKLLNDTRIIEVEDFGAGSAIIKSKQRAVKDIAASSLKSKKFAWLLFRIVKKYQPENILELGTSFGISTAYLASGNPRAKLITCEGAASIAGIAQQNFEQMGFKNIQLVHGDFDKTLPGVLKELEPVGLAFIDGNHRKKPTLDYFHQILANRHSKSILIFDDIHWSREMEDAWEQIKQDPAVSLTIDLFFIGLVFFDPGFKIPQHFSIRF